MGPFRTILREYFELKYGLKPFSYSELSPKLKQEANHLYHTKGGRNLATMWVTKEKLRRKWEPFGLLDGITRPIRENIAKLFESQAVHILNEGPQAAYMEPIPFPTVRCDGLGKRINGYTN